MGGRIVLLEMPSGPGSSGIIGSIVGALGTRTSGRAGGSMIFISWFKGSGSCWFVYIGKMNFGRRLGVFWEMNINNL